jgi:type 1 glutamine amidotransferase
VSDDASAITEANLSSFDAIVLASTSGAFLDDPDDAPATAARRKAFLDFVRGGKGVAGLHAATVGYYEGRPGLGTDGVASTWPEFTRLIGGLFKFHWNDGQKITVEIDEPDHPLNAPFKKLKGPLVINDETYTMGRDTYSRQNVRVLTSVDYSKMCDEDKKKEVNPRADQDYALSWIKRDGKGRVFYLTHGHDESVYAKTPILEHLLAGMQYALGDLQADDSPVKK